MIYYLKKKKERKMEGRKPALPAGRQKIFISKTLHKRGITEEKIVELESRGLLKTHGIYKNAEGRYIQYLWYKGHDNKN